MNKPPILYLLPAPIVENDSHNIPQYSVEIMHSLKYFIVERARTTRRFISSTGYKGNINDLTIFELDKRDPTNIPEDFLKPLRDGKDIGLMSEAGMPGIADPGAKVVELAHKIGAKVVPLVGPSSIFLALAASGMNGQQFAFKGYLPVNKGDLNKKLNQLEKLIFQTGETQIFIETPYRNESLFRSVLIQMNPNLKFCVAIDISSKEEYIKTLKISEWKKAKMPDMHKKPCVFLLGK